jgi:hypothetical protein
VPQPFRKTLALDGTPDEVLARAAELLGSSTATYQRTDPAP